MTEAVRKRKALTFATAIFTVVILLGAGLALSLILLVQIVNERTLIVGNQRLIVQNQLDLLGCLTPGPTPVELPNGLRVTGHPCFDAESARRDLLVKQIIDNANKPPTKNGGTP